MRSGERIVVEDATISEILVGQPSLNVLIDAGVRAVISTPRYSLTYGAANPFKQLSKPLAEPHILELASSNLAIHPAFVLGRTLVSCSSA
jgi:hypothetical protein